MRRTFLQASATWLAGLSAFFLVKGSFFISTKDIAMLSIGRLGIPYDEVLARNLATQQADTWVGSSILLLSLFFQMANLMWEMRYEDFAISKRGLVLSIIFSIVIFFIAWFAAGFFAKNILEGVEGFFKNKI